MDRTRLSATTAVVVDPHPGDYAPLEHPPGVSQLRTVQLKRMVRERSRFGTALHRFDIRFVPDGRSALRLSRRNGSALWMINTQLPDMTGFDLFEMLSPDLVKTPVFLVANDYSPLDERESFRLGASKFLCKPVAPAWLAGLRRLGSGPGAGSGPAAGPSVQRELQTPRPPPPGVPTWSDPGVYYERLDDP